MKQTLILFSLVLSILISACGKPAPVDGSATTITTTPDLCSSTNLPAEVTKVNKFMREFDDYSSLASNTPQAQLINIIPEMQRILRDVEDLQVPSCLQTLKELEMGHMDLVINVLIAFMNTTNTDTQTITAGIAKARELHAKYDIEKARLLGITLVVQPTKTPGPAPDVNATTPAATPAYITNLGPGGINLRSAPSLDAPEAGILAAQVSTAALGRSPDSQWIKVEVPGQPQQTAWVFASLVQLSVPIDQLPVTE